jgi:hypothetical protein
VAEEIEKDGEGGDTGRPEHGIINTRHLDEFRDTAEFLGYEKLCRGEDTHVRTWLTHSTPVLAEGIIYPTFSQNLRLAWGNI